MMYACEGILVNEWRSIYDAEKIVEWYDQRLRIIGMQVDERDEAVLSMIPCEKQKHFRLLDLGAGMGRFTMKVADRFPNAEIVCVDGSAQMLEVAKSKLGEHSFAFVCRDFGQPSWIEGLSGTFNVIVSTGAIHHVSDQRKRRLFVEVHRLLNDGGYFINGDLVKSRYDILNTKYYDDVWAHHIQQKTLEVLGLGRSIEEVRRRMHASLKKEGDKPSTIEDQLRWLGEAGFRVADCVWQYYLLAVIVGIK